MIQMGTTISDGEEDGEDSSTSPLHNMRNHFQSALDDFRDNWQKELKGSDNSSDPSPTIEDDIERAERLFKQGIELEKCGKVYDALKFYRKAVHIVPDIEFRIYETSKSQQASETNNNRDALDGPSVVAKGTIEDQDDENLTGVNLVNRFQTDLNQNGRFIVSSIDSGVISTSMHISNLPYEIVLYILRWVISSQLDMRSLEQCSSTCKGLYLCAREPEIWRQACQKVWGANTDSLAKSPYTSWRQMFIERERIHYNGCYISKTTYLRYGENSFQDEFYRPIQLIEYYRYLRFLPDGTVLMMTSSDEPAQGVGKLKMVTTSRPDILRGNYTIHGSIVLVVLPKNQKAISHVYNKRRGSIAPDYDAGATSTFYIELNIVSTGKRKFCQLHWKNYSLIQKRNKKELTSDFELTSSKFPPLCFSRVKSYHLEAEAPLQ